MTLKDSLGLTAITLFGPFVGLGLAASCAQEPSAAPLPIAESHPLQGTWKSVPGESDQVTVTIEGNSLYFYRKADFQYDTSFTLVPDSEPAELRATILDTPRTTDSAGEVVTAIYAFDNGTLHLAAVNKVEGEPLSFEETSSSYRLAKAETPQ